MAQATGTEGMFRMTREFAAPRERVWAAWTDPPQFARWWGPRGFTVPFVQIDLRPGGAMHFCMRSRDGRDHWNKGIFLEVSPPERLVSSDYFSDEQGNKVPPARYGMAPDFPDEALLSVTLEAVDGKTRLTLVHSVPEEVAERQGMQQGWSETLDRLGEYLESVQAIGWAAGEPASPP